MPPVTGFISPAKCFLKINSCEYLEDIFITHNKLHTKYFLARKMFNYFAPNTIFFQATEHPTYLDKRKALSAAFFKSKLISMTKIIKQVALNEVKRIQDASTNEHNLVQFTIDFYSQIIINCIVGTGYSGSKIPFEKEDGSLVEYSI